MRLAVVTPRYGPSVAGGAETAARLLAEALVARRGWSVEVLTTTAIDTDWNDGFAPGTETIAGVTVRRFAVEGRRVPAFATWCDRIFPAPRRATRDDELAWLTTQGPVSAGLIDAVAALDPATVDAVALHPYLYHPTIAGRAAARVPTILHGAAHDEPALALGIVRDLYEQVDGHAFWSEAERRLVHDRFAVGARPQAVVGLGVEAGPGDEAAARAAVGLGERPYVLCLGRVDDGKGAALLARLFAEHAARHDDDLVLVFAGPVVHAPPPHPRIVVAGRVAESVKWGLLRGARAVVSPSAMESFGIVLAEAWVVGRPVLVNARCAVTAGTTRDATGGLGFGDGAGFSASLARLTGDAGLAAALGAAGAAYAARHFTWSRTVERYERLVRAVAAGRS